MDACKRRFQNVGTGKLRYKISQARTQHKNNPYLDNLPLPYIQNIYIQINTQQNYGKS